MKRQYADDGLMMEDSTTVNELMDFVKRRTRNPFVIDGKLVWSYSSHKTDINALQTAVENKLEHDAYMIPFQVTGVWGYMTHIIPHDISRNARVLVYLQDEEEYVEYNNLLGELDRERIDDFKNDLENDLSAFTDQ